MTYAEIIFELKRLASLAEEYNFELANEINNIINEHEPPSGECST